MCGLRVTDTGFLSAFHRHSIGVRLLLYCIRVNKGEQVTLADHAYRVYIVRCWDDGEAPEGNASRFVLEIPRTNERYGFTRPEDLLKALQYQLGSPGASAPSNPNPVEK